ncbi:MAG: DUF3788 domain-containing protein [Defluviitaleaceae bacterium]|nr:DUF3788 domain-containing protein [Defluviitaleaceae bacterium]
MAISIFDDKSITPNHDMVAVALGDTNLVWDELQSYVNGKFPNITGEWKHYGKASGWAYKLISKKRNLLFFIPQADCFRVRIVLGEKAVACVTTADLPDDIKEMVQTATPYIEGRSIDIDINSKKQLETVKILLNIKFDN